MSGRPARPMALAELLGMRAGEAGEGRCTFECDVHDEHLNPYGVVHGGVIYTLVDYAMGSAVFSGLQRGERCATLEIKINYLAAASAGTLRAEAVIVARTSRIAVLEAKVHGDDGRQLAVALGTYYIQRDGGSAGPDAATVDTGGAGG